MDQEKVKVLLERIAFLEERTRLLEKYMCYICEGGEMDECELCEKFICEDCTRFCPECGSGVCTMCHDDECGYWKDE